MLACGTTRASGCLSCHTPSQARSTVELVPPQYGVLVVDLGQRHPVDVLPDDEASTLAGWLRNHPRAEVVARDRGHKIREGVTLGAPSAVQVADRFHLLRNVVDALDELQRQRRAAGSAAFWPRG